MLCSFVKYRGDYFMYCKKCGSDVGQSNFCPNCGSSVHGNLYAESHNVSVENFNLITAYKSMFKKYAQFNGRSRRSEYWLASVMNWIIFMVFYLVIYVPMIVDMQNYGKLSVTTSVLMFVFALLMFAYCIAVFVPSLAMSVRRLHDTGQSGWFLLLNLIPCVGGIIIFVFSLLDSQPGTNQYGHNPKGL